MSRRTKPGVWKPKGGELIVGGDYMVEVDELRVPQVGERVGKELVVADPRPNDKPSVLQVELGAIATAIAQGHVVSDEAIDAAFKRVSS